MIKVGLITLTALSSAIVAMDASAACMSGSTYKATVTLNKAVLATMVGDSTKRIPAGSIISPVPSNSDTGTGAWSTYGNRYIYLNAFIAEAVGASPNPSTWTYTTLNNTVPTTNAPGINGDATGTTYYPTYSLPVVCATTATPNYSTTFKTGNVISTYNGSSGAIGLAGVFKVRSSFQNPTLSTRYGKLSLIKDTAGKWELRDNLNGASVFKLTEVYTSTVGTTLTLKANLRFANAVEAYGSTTIATSDWGRCYRGVTTHPLTSGLCDRPDGGAGTWWITSGINSSENALMMGAGTGTTTATGTGVLTGLTPNAYKTSASATPTGSEALALAGRIELTYQY